MYRYFTSNFYRYLKWRLISIPFVYGVVINLIPLEVFAPVNPYLLIVFTLMLYGVINYLLIFKELKSVRIDSINLLLAMMSQTAGLILFFSHLYRVDAIAELTSPASFVDSLYFSLVTWTTLGYGDLSPTPQFRLVTGIQAILGYLYLGGIVGLTIGVLSSHVKDGEE